MHSNPPSTAGKQKSDTQKTGKPSSTAKSQATASGKGKTSGRYNPDKGPPAVKLLEDTALTKDQQKAADKARSVLWAEAKALRESRVPKFSYSRLSPVIPCRKTYQALVAAGILLSYQTASGKSLQQNKTEGLLCGL